MFFIIYFNLFSQDILVEHNVLQLIIGGFSMKKFKIQSSKKEYENKTIRFPLPLVKKIEEIIDDKDVSFSGFVIQACEFALENLDDSENEKQ